MDGIDWDQVAAEYRSGASLARLGRRWGKSARAIRVGLVRAGVELEDGPTRAARGLAAFRARQQALLADRDAWVVEIYSAGRTVAETARITGVQPTQVGRIVQRAGVSRRRGPAPRSRSVERDPADRVGVDVRLRAGDF